MNVAFLFAGQGAHYVGMGIELCNKIKIAENTFKRADEVLGWSVSSVCFEGPEEKLTESGFCQPAIFTFSMACLYAFKERYPDVMPVGVAGLSLGEFGALCAAEVVSFEECLKLVAERGKLMDEACKQTNGAMASVLGGDKSIVEAVCTECGVTPANYNSPGQIVISGHKDKIDKAIQVMKDKGLKRIVPLKVAGAYHSPLMKSAEEKFNKLLNSVRFKKPLMPVVQNYSGTPETDPDKIKENLSHQITGSVQWEKSVRELEKLLVTNFIEFGPGKVLSGLLKRISKQASAYNVEKPSDLDNISF